jgi:hypothetical protein
MPRFATVNRDRAVTVVEEIIFSGRPSQVINLPAYLKGIIGAIIVLAACLYTATRWPVPWYAPLIALVIIAVSVVLAYLRTACTEVIIDTGADNLSSGHFESSGREPRAVPHPGCDVAASVVAATVRDRHRGRADQRLEQSALAVARDA